MENVPTPDYEKWKHREDASIHFLSKLKEAGFWEQIRNNELKDRFFSKITPEQFEQIVVLINRTVRETLPEDQQAPEDLTIESETSYVRNAESNLISDVPIHWQQRRLLVEKVIVPTIHELEPHYRPSFAATAINMMHPFEDGNGRTSRLLFLTMFPLEPQEESDEPLTDKEVETSFLWNARTRIGGWNFDPTILKDELYKIVEQRKRFYLPAEAPTELPEIELAEEQQDLQTFYPQDEDLRLACAITFDGNFSFEHNNGHLERLKTADSRMVQNINYLVTQIEIEKFIALRSIYLHPDEHMKDGSTVLEHYEHHVMETMHSEAKRFKKTES